MRSLPSLDSWEGRLGEAEAAFRSGREAEAVAILRELTIREYANAPFWHRVSKLAAGFGQLERAQRRLGQAHRLRPHDGISLRLELLTDAIHDSTAAIREARERFERGLDRLIEAPPRIHDPLNKADLPMFYLAYHGLCNRALHMKVARGLVSQLSRDRFEVFVLNIPPVTMDETASWIQARADHWLVLDESLPAARTQIAAAGRAPACHGSLSARRPPRAGATCGNGRPLSRGIALLGTMAANHPPLGLALTIRPGRRSRRWFVR